MEIPDAISAQMLEFVRAAVSTSEQAYQAMNELDELVTSGFRGHEVDLVEKMLLRLDELEHQADKLEREIRAVLFSIERELYPVDVMFLYQTIHWIGDLADRAQQTGSRLHLLLAR
jgi:hypothetical protein